jgi:hypothetical protein
VLSSTTIRNDETDLGFRAQLSKLIIKFARASGYLPSSLFIKVEAVSDEAVAFGGFADIYEGVYLGRKVALKRLRPLDQTQSREVAEKFCREVINWHYLQHPNVLPFLGLEGENTSAILHIAMVSPWMDNGNMLQFIIRQDLQATELKRLVSYNIMILHFDSRTNLQAHSSPKQLKVCIIFTYKASCTAIFDAYVVIMGMSATR